MKLRQKLAIVLASAMVVTAVPVVTMAASTSSISKVVTVAEDTVLGDAAPVLSIKLQHGFTTSQSFYLALENAKWDDVTTLNVTNQDGETVGTLSAVKDAKDATVSFLPTSEVEIDDTLYISLKGIKVTGEAKVTVDAVGTEIDNATITFANKSDAKATVTAKDAKTFYTTTAAGEEVGTIVITEAVVGSFASEDEADRTITIDLEHGDYEFLNNTLTVTGKRGFTGINGAVSVTVNADKDRLTVVLPRTNTATQVGTFEITGIKVKSIDKAPEAGDLEVTVEGKDNTKVTSGTVKVATVAEYGTVLTVAEKKEVVAGKDTKVKITYKETTKDSIGKNDVDFVLSQGYVDYNSVTNNITVSATAGPVIALSPIYEDKDAEKAEDATKIIGFTLTTKGDDTKAEKYIDGKEIKIRTTLDMTGDIVLSTSGRYVEEQEVVVAEAKPNFTVKAEAMTLKVGQSKQVGGKFVITEDKAGALDKSSVITLELPKEEGISFTELPTVTVDGAKAKVEWKDKTSKSAINVTLTKSSKETPATITVEGLEVKVDRTVAQGAYDLELSINNYEGTLTSEDFFVVGTPNTEELAANGLPKGTATFTINSAEYTVNGKVATMDATAYIQDPGYTMVPVRYVATAFGVNAQDILYSNGTATIFAGSRTIQLTAGSDVAVVNGASIKLATKVVVKDGRTYAPVGEIARILGVSANWDGTNKVATFVNK